MVPRLFKTAVVMGILGVASFARATAILDLEQTPIDISALELPSDGEWMEGRDYGYTNLTIWMTERWQGGLGSSVRHMTSIELDPTRGGVSPTPITIHKTVENVTVSDIWRSFEIIIVPASGSAISNVEHMIVDPMQFNELLVDTTPTGQPAGSISLIWNDPDPPGTPPDNGVGPTEIGLFDFSFEITGNIQFELIQIPSTSPYIPEPMSAGFMVTGALLILGRRRRRA